MKDDPLGILVSTPTRVRSARIELSVVIPAKNEAENLALLLPELKAVLESLKTSYEIIVIDRSPEQRMVKLADKYQVDLIDQVQPGYGKATRIGIVRASGAHILTMDANLSHSPTCIKNLWETRQEADLIVASRYVRGAKYQMPLARTFLSRGLNILFSRGLSFAVRDMSSGFRLYNAKAMKRLELTSPDFAILQEILVKAYCEGWSVLEIPFDYRPHQHGNSFARMFAFGISYLRAFSTLYRLRNSILSADYDDRAYNSIVLPQRYWQRQRFRHIVGLSLNEGKVLDVGSGSSSIIGALPQRSVAIDILLRKLRYARKFGRLLVQASGFNLPFGDASYPCVVCSEVIEHVPKDSPILSELERVLAPGGL